MTGPNVESANFITIDSFTSCAEAEKALPRWARLHYLESLLRLWEQFLEINTAQTFLGVLSNLRHMHTKLLKEVA